jgi:hypothetical protein
MVSRGLPQRPLARDLSLEEAPFIGLQPLGIRGPVVQKSQRHNAERDGGEPLDEEEPLPAVEPSEAVELEQPARDRSTGDVRGRDRREEESKRAGALALREPPRQVEDDPWEESRLGHAEQETEHIEAHRAADEHRRRGQQAPNDHDQGEPAAGAEAVERQVARYSGEDVSE